jgi:glucose/arabinose dehydrogenase
MCVHFQTNPIGSQIDLTNDYVAFAILFIALLTLPQGTAALANMSNSNPTLYEAPTIFDHTLDVELVYKGIANPTDIEFLGDDDILVLEKNEGTSCWHYCEQHGADKCNSYAVVFTFRYLIQQKGTSADHL